MSESSPRRSADGPRVSGPRIVCIGNLTIDEAVHGGVSTGPAMGGDAAYAALGARLYCDDVRMIAPVGPDLPADFLSQLASAGICAAELPQRDLPTVRNVIEYHADGSRTWQMLCSENDFDRMSVYPADVPAGAEDAEAIVLLAMSLQSQLALTPWLRVTTKARLYLDVQEDYLEGNRDALFQMISACDVFLPSEVEALALTGSQDPVHAAGILRDLGPSVVVITRAKHGVILLEGAGPAVTIDVPSVEPVDSTGAGDAFCGGFAAVHLASGDCLAAVKAGAHAARIAISDVGLSGILGATTTLTTRQRVSG